MNIQSKFVALIHCLSISNEFLIFLVSSKKGSPKKTLFFNEGSIVQGIE